LATLNVPFRTDASNADLSFPRNRVRHEVLPVMARLAPGAAESIARAAGIAADDEDFLEAYAIEALPAIVLSDEGQALRLDRSRLTSLHPAIARRVLRHALTRVGRNRFIALRHIEAVRALACGSLDLPGVSARVESGLLVLAPAEGRWRPGKGPESNVFRYPLSIPGEALVRESGVRISAEIVIGAGAAAENPMDGVRLSAAVLDPDGGAGGLFIRNRRPGDRFRPFGMAGSRKLQDYLVDRKVPRSERDRLPLVVDGRDRIVWVVGHTVADDYRVTDPKEPVLLLKVRHLGDI
jgi:tRNA(Ile)-lysidine synthase